MPQSNAKPPEAVINMLAEHYGTRERVLHLCRLSGQSSACVPGVSRPRDLWVELWAIARSGAAIDFDQLVRAAFGEFPANPALKEWLAATPRPGPAPNPTGLKLLDDFAELLESAASLRRLLLRARRLATRFGLLRYEVLFDIHLSGKVPMESVLSRTPRSEIDPRRWGAEIDAFEDRLIDEIPSYWHNPMAFWEKAGEAQFTIHDPDQLERMAKWALSRTKPLEVTTKALLLERVVIRIRTRLNDFLLAAEKLLLEREPKPS